MLQIEIHCKKPLVDISYLLAAVCRELVNYLTNGTQIPVGELAVINLVDVPKVVVRIKLPTQRSDHFGGFIPM